MEVKALANIKSSKKRVEINQRQAERNKAVRSRVKTYEKKVYEAIESKDKEKAKEALRVATSEIEKAKSKGVFKKETASRKVSRLSLAVNKME